MNGIVKPKLDKSDTKYELGKDYYFFHSFVENQADVFRRLMYNAGRDPDGEKFYNFYHSGDSVQEVEKSLGLDIREIMCCVSKVDPAVVYHRPFGLILSGKPKVFFDNDSGNVMLPDGTYNSKPYYSSTTKQVSLDTLLTSWYDTFSKRNGRSRWNEAILNKGSKIIGAFHDPNYDFEMMSFAYGSTFQEKEYCKFLEKIDQLCLNLIEINAKHK